MVCGAIVNYGLLFVWKKPWLKLSGMLRLLCVSATYHAIYNMFVGAGGVLQVIGFAFPTIAAVLCLIIKRRWTASKQCS